jgi:hypothetical protein
VTTFVLIPGAGGDSWDWHLLVRELEARGHEAIAARSVQLSHNAVG